MNLMKQLRQSGAPEAVLKDIDPDSFGMRAEKVLTALTAADAHGLPAMLAWFDLATMQSDRGDARTALAMLGRGLDDKFVFAPGAEAAVAWREQMQQRFARMNLWLDEYERSREEELLQKVRAELKTAGEMYGGANVYAKVVEARTEYLKHRYWSALGILHRAKDNDVYRVPQASFLAGMCFFELDETGAAVRHLNRFLRGTPATFSRKERVRAAVAVSKCMVRFKDFDSAVASASSAFEQAPDDAESILALANARTMQLTRDVRRGGGGGEIDRGRAVESIRELIGPLTEAGDSQAVRLLARLLEMDEEQSRAEELLINQCSTYPDDFRSLALLCKSIAQNANRRGDALEWLKKGLIQLESTPAGRLLADVLAADDEQTIANGVRVLNFAAIDGDEHKRNAAIAMFARETGRTELYEQIKSEMPADNQYALLLQWEDAVRTDDARAARRVIERAARIPEMAYRDQIWQMQLLLAEKQPELLLKKIEELTLSYPPSSSSYALAAQAHEMKNELEQAQNNFEQAMRMRPDNVKTLKQLIEVCVRRKLDSQAMQYMRLALRQSPNDESLMRSFLRYLETDGNAREALEIRLRLAEFAPEDESNLLATARLMMQAGRLREAQKFTLQLLDKNPQNFDALLIDSRLQALESGEHEAAARRVRTFLQSHPRQATVENWCRAARLMIQLDCPEPQVIDAFAAAMKSEGDINVARQNLARWHIGKGRFDQAIAILDELYAETRAPEFLLQKAESCMRAEKLDAAESALNEYFDIVARPGDDAKLSKARLEIMKGNLKPAESILTEIIENSPGLFEPYMIRAQLVMEKPELARQVNQAKADLQKVVELKPGLEAARYMLANMLSDDNDNAQAIIHLKKLLNIDPNNKNYYAKLAQIYFIEEKLDKIAELRKKWNKLFPDKPLPLVPTE